MTLPLVAVDIGNSSKKLGLFPHAGSEKLVTPTEVIACETLAEPPAAWVAQLPERVAWRVASVHRSGESQLAEWVRTRRPADTYQRLQYTDFPLAVKVDVPARLGLDRLAAALAANALRERHRAAVVVDAGSALTVDLVSPDSEFLGGAILPGFRLGAQVLAQATDQLPLTLLETAAEPPPPVGTNTEAAIRSGLFWGAVGAVRELIARYAERFPEPQVFITGGDLRRLAPLVNANSQFVPHLVLSGIACAKDS